MLKLASKEHLTRDDVIQRYPRLVGHMICESLGYFTPEAAANALASYIKGVPCFCEWYTHMAGMCRGEWPKDDQVLEVGKRVVWDAFRNRHHHYGYMADYRQSRALVEHVRQGGQGPLFASWF